MVKINIPEDLVMKHSGYWNKTEPRDPLHMYGNLVVKAPYKPVGKELGESGSDAGIIDYP